MNENLGTVTIAPNVLITIARLTALAQPGVTRTAPNVPGSTNRLWSRSTNTATQDGVQVTVEDGSVTVDLYVIVAQDVNMLQLGQQIQTGVTRAIQDLVGMAVKEVNVFIRDVESASEETRANEGSRG